MIRPFLCPGLRSAFHPEEIGKDCRTHIDNLWEFARFLFERITVRIEDAPSLAAMRKLKHTYRRDFLAWLEPVESLVRRLIVIQAITWMLMTVEGRRLLANTPKAPPPGPLPTPKRGASKPIEPPEPEEDYELRPLPGTPEEIEAAYLALPVKREQTDHPSIWICPFEIIHFDRSQPRDEDGWHGEPSHLTYDQIASLDYLHNPYASLADDDEQTSTRNWDLLGFPRGISYAARNLARRVEALGRVIANPEPHVKRTARILARLPLRLFADPPPPPRWWMQDAEVILAANKLLTSALNAFWRTQEVVTEPG